MSDISLLNFVRVSDLITVYLDKSESEFEALRERADYQLKKTGDPLVKGQLRYAENAKSAIAHMMTHIPKKYDDMLVLNAELQAKIESQAIQEYTEREQCQLSEQLETYSLAELLSLQSSLFAELQRRAALLTCSLENSAEILQSPVTS